MTEQEWLAWKEPGPILSFLGDDLDSPKRAFAESSSGGRKFRLYACACCRRVWHLITDRRAAHAVEPAERYADGRASGFSLLYAVLGTVFLRRGADKVAGFAASIVAGPGCLPDGHAAGCAWYAADAVQTAALGEPQAARRAEEVAQAALVRCVFGNPFHPVSLDPVWLTPAVSSLAQGAYEERARPSGELDPARLAVLADALEEAGCAEEPILSHLRSAGPHVRGCWAIDLVLNKQ